MWALNNLTQFKAERAFARDADGAEIWVVAVKGTFDILDDGRVVPSEEQLDVCLAPEYVGEPATSSLRFDMDLNRTKVGTDIVLNAQAYAPGGRPAREVVVEVAVGGLRKRLAVVGNRAWKQGAHGLEPGAAESFVTMPIRYERAFGGPLDDSPDALRDPANPAGVGRIALSGAALPNVEHPEHRVSSPQHEGVPAGLGPIPGHWSARARFAGTYDDKWAQDRQPLVPDDFSDDYFQCAPVDQQVRGFLKGWEEVALRNLTASGELRFSLPRVSLGFRTRFENEIVEHRAQLHTVAIEPDERRLVLVWQSSLPCHHTIYQLQETTVLEKVRLA